MIPVIKPTSIYQQSSTSKARIDSLPGKNFPVLTLLLGFIASIATISPQLTSLMQFDRTAILQGELWRTLTGHFTHWSSSHLFWDLLVFVILAGFIERISRLKLLTCFAACSLFISLLVFAIIPEMSFYRGLSGIDNGLFMMLLVLLYRKKTTGQKLRRKIPYFLLGILFISKSMFELSTAQNVFVDSSGLFIPVPLAHLGGAFIGWLLGTLQCQKP